MASQDQNTHKNYVGHLPESEDIDIRGLFATVWRKKLLVLAVTLIGLASSIVLLSQVSPRYVARSSILIKPNIDAVASAESALLSKVSRLDAAFILTELEILKSRNLASKVFRRLDLMKDPDFMAAKEVSSLLKENTNKDVKREFRNLSVQGTKLKTVQPEFLDPEVSQKVTKFLDSLRVNSIAGSAVQVSFISTNPHKAANIVNTLVDEYIKHKLFQKQNAQKRITDWLDSRLKTLRTHVFEAETQIEAYKARNNLVQGKKYIISAEQLSDLNQKLVQAQSQLAEAKAKLKQFSSQKINTSLSAVQPNTIDGALIRNLSIQRAELESDISHLANRYGPKHPVMIKKRFELADIKRALEDGLKQSKQTLRGNVKIAQARIDEIQSNIDNVTLKGLEDSAAMIRLRELEREADSSKQVLEAFLESYKRSAGQTELQKSDVEVISYASVPHEPSYPQKDLILLLSGFVSLLIGIALTILIEKINDVYHDANQLEKDLAIPCYGTIQSPKDVNKNKRAGYVLSNPASRLSEAVRSVGVALSASITPEPGQARTITITSSNEPESTALMTIWLARLNARSGESAILVDANLRAPSVHKELEMNKSQPSLVDYLTDQNKLEDVIQKDRSTNLDVICTQPIPNSAFDLLNSEKFSKLIETLQSQYDLVILNAPACKHSADARLLAKKSDGLLYLVTAGVTKKDQVRTGIKYFIDQRTENMGTLLFAQKNKA